MVRTNGALCRTYVRTFTYVPLRQRYVPEYPLGTYVTCVVVRTYVRSVRSAYERRKFPKHNQIYKKLKGPPRSNWAMKPMALPYMCIKFHENQTCHQWSIMFHQSKFKGQSWSSHQYCLRRWYGCLTRSLRGTYAWRKEITKIQYFNFFFHIEK